MALFKSRVKEHDDSTKNKEVELFRKTSDKWNFEAIKLYIRGKDLNHELTDTGLAAIIDRFLHKREDDAKANHGKRREFEIYDRPERTKKGMDIFLSMMLTKEIEPPTLDKAVDFVEIYKDVIEDLDNKLQQTYMHKLKETYKNAQIAALVKKQISKSLDSIY